MTIITASTEDKKILYKLTRDRNRNLQKMLWTMQMLQDLQWDGCRKETDYYEKSGLTNICSVW